MGNWIKPIRSRVELIELAFEQMEKEANVHIKNIQYNNDDCIDEEDKYTVCEFNIEEIPGFRFAFWNTRRSENIKDWFKEERIKWFDSLDISYMTELIFFCQYERDLDKFKPSRSGFVTGIYRQEYIKEPDPDEEEIDIFCMYDLIAILKYMKKHHVRSVEYSGCQTRYIWEDDRSYFNILRQFINDWIYTWKSQFKEWKKYKKICRGSKKLLKKLTQFNYILKDQGNTCYPRVEIVFRRKDNIDLTTYNKEWDIIDKFDKKYGNIMTIYCMQYDIDETSTEEIITKDRELRENFYWHCHTWITRSENMEWEDTEKLIMYSIEEPSDYKDIIKKKNKEWEDDETSSNT